MNIWSINLVVKKVNERYLFGDLIAIRIEGARVGLGTTTCLGQHISFFCN